MTVKAITRLNWSWFIWFSHWLLEMVSNTILPLEEAQYCCLLAIKLTVVKNQACNCLVSCHLDFKVTNVIGFNYLVCESE